VPAQVFTCDYVCPSIARRPIPGRNEDIMSTRRKTPSAKALVFDPLFRPRQQKAKKGKGSYHRRPRNPQNDSGPSFLWARLATAAAVV
jgi:stalled ribosome alternative rescue factor ArfA